MHLRLPGYGEDGPTLEIFEYIPSGEDVDNVPEALREVLAAGGKEFRSIVSVPVSGAGVVTFVYVADPEGSIIELQSWSRER